MNALQTALERLRHPTNLWPGSMSETLVPEIDRLYARITELLLANNALVEERRAINERLIKSELLVAALLERTRADYSILSKRADASLITIPNLDTSMKRMDFDPHMGHTIQIPEYAPGDPRRYPQNGEGRVADAIGTKEA